MTNPTTPPPPPEAGALIPPEAIGPLDQHGVMRSDNAGLIMLFQQELRDFIHVETGTRHTHAETWGADPHDAAAAPIRFYPVRVANSKPDPRWFENIAAELILDEVAPEVVVQWAGDLKELTDEIRDETRARVWDDSDRRLAPYDTFALREAEFDLAPDMEIANYRQSIRDAAAVADAEITAAADMPSLGRAESKYDQTVNSMAAPDRNPHRRA